MILFWLNRLSERGFILDGWKSKENLLLSYINNAIFQPSKIKPAWVSTMWLFIFARGLYFLNWWINGDISFKSTWSCWTSLLIISKFLKTKKFQHWLISDLIPKKYEKSEFWKIFVTMILSMENWPKKRKNSCSKKIICFITFDLWIKTSSSETHVIIISRWCL